MRSRNLCEIAKHLAIFESHKSDNRIRQIVHLTDNDVGSFGTVRNFLEQMFIVTLGLDSTLLGSDNGVCEGMGELLGYEFIKIICYGLN